MNMSWDEFPEPESSDRLPIYLTDLVRFTSVNLFFPLPFLSLLFPLIA